jgi:hypothetical protein
MSSYRVKKEKLDALIKDEPQLARFGEFLRASYGYELLAFHLALKAREC